MRKRSLPLTILLIDDQPDNLAVARDLLVYWGATVHAVTSAEEALTCLERLAPDVVLTDISMPTMDGYEFLARARAAYPSLPVIAVTAYPDRDREAVRCAGFSGCIRKPLSLELAEHIRSCLSLLRDVPSRTNTSRTTVEDDPSWRSSG